jgi:hypothetical protein
MKNVDMSPKAVTARLRQISQLRRLALSLRKARLQPPAEQSSRGTQPNEDEPKQKQKLQ